MHKFVFSFVQFFLLYSDDAAKAIYFYGPMGITVICNIVLFISTALKIRQHKKDTAHHLKGMDSRRHDDNKQWYVFFNFSPSIKFDYTFFILFKQLVNPNKIYLNKTKLIFSSKKINNNYKTILKKEFFKRNKNGIDTWKKKKN